MLSKTRSVVAVALAATAFTPAPALAASTDLRGESAASLSTHTPGAIAQNDLRGENAAARSDTSPAQDLRTADARQPVDQPTQPVVVEVTNPADAGFDWTAAIIGMGAGLALAVLAGVGVAGGRRRHVRPSVS